jgi:hypothetical protein
MKKINKKLSPNERQLTRRYLLWCYKTTKESLDRIDRYFTQLKVDHYVLASLSKRSELADAEQGSEYLKKVNEFQKYIEEKAEKVLPQKFIDAKKEKIQPEYWYLKARLEAIEKAISFFLGKAQLTKVQEMYEAEMTRRILEAREHT